MSLVNVALWIGGIVLVALGWWGARRPYARYRALRDERSNEARYAAWRGGVRDDPSATGASVAMAMSRRQWQLWAVVAGIGVVLIVLGFILKS